MRTGAIPAACAAQAYAETHVNAMMGAVRRCAMRIGPVAGMVSVGMTLCASAVPTISLVPLVTYVQRAEREAIAVIIATGTPLAVH